MEFTIDHFIVISFLALTLMVGLNHGKSVKTIADYALGGRNFSTGALVATIVATYASGSGFLTTLSKIYSDGFYYLLAYSGGIISLLIVALFIIPRMGEFLGNVSIAEAMGDIYGKKVRFITAIAASIGAAGLMAVQFKAFGGIIAYFIGINPTVSIVVAGLIVTIYSTLGGIKSVTFTDILQAAAFTVVILLIGFIIWGEFYTNKMSLTGAFDNPKYNISSLLNSSNKGFWDFIMLLIYFSIPVVSAVSFQRISMGRDVAQAKKAFIISSIVLFAIKLSIAWIPFLISSINPDLNKNELLPYIVNTYTFIGLKGFIVLAIIAFSMSTADSRINATATLFTNDIYKLLIKSRDNDMLVLRLFAFSLGIVTIALSLIETDLLTMVIFANSFYYPVIVPVFLCTVFGFRSSSKSVLAGMTTGLIFSIVWKKLPSEYLPFSPEVVGVLLAIASNAIVLIATHYIFRQPGGWVGNKDPELVLKKN